MENPSTKKELNNCMQLPKILYKAGELVQTIGDYIDTTFVRTILVGYNLSRI